MSEEQAPQSGPAAYEVGTEALEGRVIDDIHASVEASDQVRTGNAAVDDVIDGVAAIGDSPLAEHPAAFDDAHERLRRVLDGAAGDSPA